MALTNNDIFKKLRVALKLRDDDIVQICALVDFKVTKPRVEYHVLAVQSSINSFATSYKQ